MTPQQALMLNAIDASIVAIDASMTAIAVAVAELRASLADQPPPDTTKPIFADAVTADSITQTSYTLTLPPATDDTGVAGYELSIDDGATWLQRDAGDAAITGRTAGTTDHVIWRSRDAAGNVAALAVAVRLLDDVVIDPPAPPPAPAGKYRVQAKQLFQPIAAGSIPPRLPGQAPRWLDYTGPARFDVEYASGWRWENVGGDWIDADGVQQGPKPWASLKIVAPEWTETAFSVDITAMLAEAIRRDIPFAFLLRGNTVTDTHTRFGAKPARVVVTMVDGHEQDLALLFAGSAVIASPAQSMPTMTLPAFYEFATPAEVPASAVLHFVATVKNRYTKPDAALFLLRPDRTLPAPRPGGVDGGELDADIAAVPSILGAHRYADSDSESAYIHREPAGSPAWLSNIGAEGNWSPELWGGEVDTSKYPYRGAGKWLNPSGHTTIVKSTDIPHGPIAPGMGALRVAIPVDPQAVEGAYAAQAGLGVCRLEMPLPVDKVGRCDRLFIRQYFSWAPIDGQPDSLDLSEVKAIYKGANNTVPSWTDVGGKFGISPTHDTPYGGFSGSAGAGDGWSLRLGWGFPLTGKSGPQMGGLQVGWHLYDFASARHPLNVGGAGSFKPHSWGKVGGVLYARRWYCIETELKLNSVNKPGIKRDGTPHVINGVQQFWTDDGELRVWIDGMLAWEDTGLIFRTGPAKQPPPARNKLLTIYPIRELGVRSLLLNTYVGGTSPSTRPHMHYYAGLAYGTEYIGPMRGL